MMSAEVMKLLKPWIIAVPLCQMMALQIVQIILKQFLVTATRNAQKLKFRLCRCLSVTAALSDILLSAACRLHHLVNGAVTIFRKITATEPTRKLIQHIATLIKP